MIRQVTIKRFKQFAALDAKLPGHVVFAGPNNAGKTTFLQAIAAWDLAYRRWREMHKTQKRGGGYEFCPIARPDFLAVPLPRNSFDLLWTGRDKKKMIEIGVRTDHGLVTMEFRFDEEQVQVRPSANVDLTTIEASDLQVVYLPPMGGIATEEPEYGNDAFLQGRFAEGRPGDVIRNLMYRASQDPKAWARLCDGMRVMFGVTLEQPKRGQFLQANFRSADGHVYDLVAAGSGFQQVLMLLCVLVQRPGSVLLVDEPDAHLHVILQGTVFRHLRQIAAESNAQLLVSTHSEVVIDSTDPAHLLSMPAVRPLVTREERDALVRGLAVISNTDILLAQSVPGILYVEGSTDIQLLAAWAKVLGHPALDVLTKQLFWHRYSTQGQEDIASFKAAAHFESLRLCAPSLRALEIQDRDGNPNLPATKVTGSGFQLIRWHRYETESYLVHPEALARFVEHRVGAGAASERHRGDLREHFAKNYPPAVLENPMADHNFLRVTKARTELLGDALVAAGLPGVDYTDFHEIAAQMLPSEIHPEVKEKLDAICAAFGISNRPAANGIGDLLS
jgi:hypothetical protein